MLASTITNPQGIDLKIGPGEVHSIMGKNGSGKSTLASVLAGNENYEVTEGEITFNGKDLLETRSEERAWEGIFLAFQYPVEIPGVATSYFLKAALNAMRKSKGLPRSSRQSFSRWSRKRRMVALDEKLMTRAINEGFSGGEKKRNEVFQMAMMEPKLAFSTRPIRGWTSTRSKSSADGVNKLRTGRSFVHRRDALPSNARIHRSRLRPHYR